MLMRLVPGPPGVESVGHSYCCDFGNLLKAIKYHDKAQILPEFPFMKTVQEVELSQCKIGPTLKDSKFSVSIEILQITGIKH